MAKRHAFVSVKTQFDNVGDALITREMIRLLASRASVAVDLSRAPQAFVQTLGLEAFPNVSVLRGGMPALLGRVWRALGRGEKCYYFLLPGGLGGEKSAREMATGRAYVAMLAGLKALGVKIVHAGISYQRLGANYRALVAERVPCLHSHAVRDRISFDYLGELGIRVDAIVPDFALNLFDDPVIESRRERSHIAFSFRMDKYADRRADIMELIFAVAAARPEAGLKFVSQVGRDDGPMRDLCTQTMKRTGRACDFLAVSDSIEDCRGAYGDCTEIYSNRLHALILAMSSGCAPVPVIDRGHDAKIAGVFESIGLEEAIIELGSPPPAEPVQPDLCVLRAEAARIGAYFDTVFGLATQEERKAG